MLFLQQSHLALQFAHTHVNKPLELSCQSRMSLGLDVSCPSLTFAIW